MSRTSRHGAIPLRRMRRALKAPTGPRAGVSAAVAAGTIAQLFACGGSNNLVSPNAEPSSPPPVRPSFVVVLADDLDVPTTNELPRLPDLMRNRGLSFTRAFATQPLCAPSRASILTGRYSHNHGVIDNQPPYGFPAFRRHEAQSLAPWLKAAGYRTALVGKYLNAFPADLPDSYVAPGWDDWHAHLTSFEDGRYFNYWMSHNGSVVRYGSAQEDYSADVEAKLAVDVVRSSGGRREPLFLLLAPQAPHTPAKYAERHGSEFRYALAPRTPSFNEGNVADKPSWVRQIPLLTESDIDEVDRFQRFRLRSLRAVEDQLQRVLGALDETGRLQTTFVFFTSDNGLLMGQHRAVGRKGNAYEESIRVPLIVRGPGVPVGTTDSFALNIDLAPTLLELAGIPIPESVDGRSLVPFLRNEPPPNWSTDAYISNFGGTDLSRSLRTRDWMFNHQDTEEFELYDMRTDPFQTRNEYRVADPMVLDSLRRRMSELSVCRGASCRN